MLNFALCATKKINILTLVLSENNILNETKNHNLPPPPFKLNGRSLSDVLVCHKVIITTNVKICLILRKFCETNWTVLLSQDILQLHRCLKKASWNLPPMYISAILPWTLAHPTLINKNRCIPCRHLLQHKEYVFRWILLLQMYIDICSENV